MSEDWHGVCPHCRHRLHVHGRHTDGAHINCPGCHTAFTIPTVAPPPPPAERAAGGWDRKQAALAILGGCVMLGGLTLGLVLWASSRRKEEPSSQYMAQAAPSSAASPQAPDSRKEANPAPPPRTKPSDQPPVDDTPPPLPAPQPTPRSKPDKVSAKLEPIKWLPPEEQAKVDRAVARGVAWLKENQQGDGSWGDGGQLYATPPGTTALAGLALLHCGVPARDPAVQNAAAYLRQHAQTADLPFSHQQGEKGHGVYVSALAILFFDGLGERRDEDLIRTLSLALLGGQSESGKWTYCCPILPAEAERSLLDKLRKSRPESPRQLFNAEPRIAAADRNSLGDNSNTQFAVMGLWAAARHQIPTEQDQSGSVFPVSYSEGLLKVRIRGAPHSMPFEPIEEGHGRFRLNYGERSKLGIYKWESGRVFICRGFPGKARPTSFHVGREVHSLTILHRVKPRK